MIMIIDIVLMLFGVWCWERIAHSVLLKISNIFHLCTAVVVIALSQSENVRKNWHKKHKKAIYGYILCKIAQKVKKYNFKFDLQI